VPVRTRQLRTGECLAGVPRRVKMWKEADLRDIQAYNKTDPSLKPLRKYTGHSSNVGVSTGIVLAARADSRMSIGTRRTTGCSGRSAMTGSS